MTLWETAAGAAWLIQLVAAFIVAFFGVLAILWTISEFVEERLVLSIRIVRVIIAIVVVISLVQLGSSHNVFAKIGMVVTNLLWAVFSVTGFPYVRDLRVDVFGAIVLSVLTQAALIFDALAMEQSLALATSTMVLMVWLVPLGVAATVIVGGEVSDTRTGMARMQRHVFAREEKEV